MDNFLIACCMSAALAAVGFCISLGLICADRPRLGIIVVSVPAALMLVLWMIFTVIAIHTGYIGPGQGYTGQ